ncbi:MAG: MCE family protein [Nitrospirae bacterium]|nr:MCE family protein [Nitrospirota bacterium]
MKMHYSHTLSSARIAQIVGTFVVVPLFGLVVVGIFMAKAEHLFEEKYVLHASLNKSYGLEPGASVLVSGIPIGRVAAVEFNEQGTIDATLQLLRRYQDKVREDSVASVAKSGLFMGQSQMAITMGSRDKPVVLDGATIKAVEPRDFGELVTEVKPVLESVQRTLLRVEEITKDVHASVRTGGQVLSNVDQATRELPAVVASVQRAVGSVERTTAALPDITGSVKKTLAAVDRAVGDVRTATRKLPPVVDAAQDAVQNIKAATESMKVMTKDMPRLVRNADAVMDDVTMIVRGAKKTFPVSAMVKNAEPESSGRSDNGLRSLRGDQVGR